MSMNTVLTDEKIMAVWGSIAEPCAIRHGNEYLILKFARAIEQAVLQSEKVQAWKKDAERYQEVRRMSLRQFSEIYEANLKSGVPFDQLIDAAMEKQP